MQIKESNKTCESLLRNLVLINFILQKLFQYMLHLTEIKAIALAEAYKKDKVIYIHS